MGKKTVIQVSARAVKVGGLCHPRLPAEQPGGGSREPRSPTAGSFGERAGAAGSLCYLPAGTQLEHWTTGTEAGEGRIGGRGAG